MNPPDSMTLGNGMVAKFDYKTKSLTLFGENGQSFVLSKSQQGNLIQFIAGVSLINFMSIANSPHEV